MQFRDYMNGVEPLLMSPRPEGRSVPNAAAERYRLVSTLICLFASAAIAVVVPSVGTVLSLLGATVATAMMMLIPAYCMGVVLPATASRKIQQAVLYFFAAVSFLSVPVTLMELTGAISKP